MPPEALKQADEGSEEFTWVPDEPIDTAIRTTTVTIIQGPAPTVVTTMITYLTPHPSDVPDGWGPPPETTQAEQQPMPLPEVTVTVGGETLTLVPDTPITSWPRPRPRNMEAEKRQNPAAPIQEKPRAKRRPSPGIGPDPASPAAKMLKRSDTPRTLESGQYWIRSVVQPNYHKYLQSSPENSASVAIMDSHATAGQYSIQDGQVISLVPTEDGEWLYLQVEHPDDLAQRKLATWFNTTANQFGTFQWQGDALTWSHPDVQRQNLAAWLVCEGQELFINTGAYAYQTPAGCADQTVSVAVLLW